MEDLNVSEVVKYFGDGKDLLARKSELVTDFDEELSTLVDRMASTMYFYDAVGISAIQVGVPKSLFLVKVDKDRYATFINPQIISQSEDKEVITEGCLSFPGILIPVLRSKEVKLKFQEKDGTEKEVEVGGLHARIILHEMRHLSGNTFLDDISILKKNVILEKMKRLNRNGKLFRDRDVIAYLQNISEKEVDSND